MRHSDIVQGKEATRLVNIKIAYTRFVLDQLMPHPVPRDVRLSAWSDACSAPTSTCTSVCGVALWKPLSYADLSS